MRAMDASVIKAASTAMISLRSDHLLRPYGLDFIGRVAARWSREAIERRLRSSLAP